MKFCVDCKHRVDEETARALNTKASLKYTHYCAGRIDPVTGKKCDIEPCAWGRTPQSLCGLEGRLFEAKDDAMAGSPKDLSRRIIDAIAEGRAVLAHPACPEEFRIKAKDWAA